MNVQDGDGSCVGEMLELHIYRNPRFQIVRVKAKGFHLRVVRPKPVLQVSGAV